MDRIKKNRRQDNAFINLQVKTIYITVNCAGNKLS